MPRPAKFDVDDVLDAAARAVAEHGRDVGIAQIARGLGAPTGSIYHRFPSRDALLVSLWVRSIERFHEGFLAAMELADADEAAVAGAVHIVAFCRAEPLDARAMLLFRHERAIELAPESLVERVTHVNDRVVAALGDLTERRYGARSERAMELVSAACVEGPYGFVRRALVAGEPLPGWLEDAVAAAARAVLAVGDASSATSAVATQASR